MNKQIIIIILALTMVCAFASADRNYIYRYYNFKIDTGTGAIKDLTVAGQTNPVFTNISAQAFNITGVRLIPYGVNISTQLNTSLEDIIHISYGLKVGARRVCVVNQTIKVFEDNETMYSEYQIESTGDQICPLFKHWIDFPAYDANYYDRILGTTTNNWRGGLFTNSNSFKSNYSVYSGTCSNGVVSYNNESYMIVVNGSTGYGLIGAVDCSSGMKIGYQSEEYSLSYLIADRNDSLEYGTDVAQTDYIGSHPNKSISVYDSATNRFVRLEVAYPGLAGYKIPQGASWRLRPITTVRNKIVANDFFRAGFFISVKNATGKQSYRTPVQAFRTDAVKTTYGELGLVNGKYIPGRFMPYDGKAGGWSKINITFYPTQAHLRENINLNSKLAYQTHLDYCFDVITTYSRDGGWWNYWDILSSIYEWGGDGYLGNGMEMFYSCNKVLGSSWLNSHRDVGAAITSLWLSGSRAYNLNPNTIMNRVQRYTIRTDANRGFEANRSGAPTTPEWSAPKKNVTIKEGFYIYHGTTVGPEAFAIYQISCNTTSGARIWSDSFQVDTSANYNKSGISYDSVRKRMISTGRTASGENHIGPKNSTKNNTLWQNVVCSFDIEPLANLSGKTTKSTQLGYIYISIKRNASDPYDNGLRYYYYGQSTGGFKYGARSGATWKFIQERNDSAGIFSNDWTRLNVTYSNTTAYMALTNPRAANLTAFSSQIINQKQYFDVGVATTYYLSKTSNDTNFPAYSLLLDNIMRGNNWLYNLQNRYFRRDGFWQYSSDNLNHDSGYFVNSMYEISKILRAKPDMPRLNDLPFVCYYNRYGRENSSGSTPAVSNYSRANALLAMSDTRCMGYTSYKAKIDPRLEEENKVMVEYPDETSELYFKPSNCSYIFNSKIGIYYPDSHIIAHSNNSKLYNVLETCTNIRLKSVNYAVINDAYQVSGTTDIYVSILPINPVRHIWNSAALESYPIGAYTATSPQWDFSYHRWKQNSTHYIYNSSSFTVSKKATVYLELANGLPSESYTLRVDNWNMSTFTTDANGYGTTNAYAGRDGANVSIVLGAASSVNTTTTSGILSDIQESMKNTSLNLIFYIGLIALVVVVGFVIIPTISSISSGQSPNISGMQILLLIIGMMIVAIVAIAIAAKIYG